MRLSVTDAHRIFSGRSISRRISPGLQADPNMYLVMVWVKIIYRVD